MLLIIRSRLLTKLPQKSLSDWNMPQASEVDKFFLIKSCGSEAL